MVAKNNTGQDLQVPVNGWKCCCSAQQHQSKQASHLRSTPKCRSTATRNFQTYF